MAVPLLSSRCRRLLVDSDLLGDGPLFPQGDPEERELRVFHPGVAPAGMERRPGVVSVLAGDGRDEGLPLLQTLEQKGHLEGTLYVTAHERRAALARRLGRAVLHPGEEPLAESLAAPALVLRDTASLLLRFKRQRQDRHLLTGVNGIDNSGKSRFAERLAAQLDSLGFQSERISMSAFTAPKKMRRDRDYPEAERLYRRGYAYDRLREQLLLPLQGGGTESLAFDVYDRERERVVEKRSLSVGERSMLLMEGPFLFQEDLFAYFDFRIYLVSDFERSLEIELEGLDGRQRKRKEKEFLRVRFAAQSLYLRQDMPWKCAHLVIRGANTQQPLIESVDEEVLEEQAKAAEPF